MNNMTSLESILAAKKRPFFMAHLVAGFPNFPTSEKVGRAMLENGADILEVQIPFSDPMADGPSIATACTEALAKGASVKKTLSLVSTLSKKGGTIVIMSYINPVFRYGIAEFVNDAAKAGAQGLIVPDAPFDSPEGIELLKETRRQGLALIPVISPGVPKARLKKLAGEASGFVYCTSRQGITGANSKFARTLTDYVGMAKKEFGVPFGLGFGVRTKADFKSAAKLADIVIAGSVFVDAIRKAATGMAPSAVKKALAKLQ